MRRNGGSHEKPPSAPRPGLLTGSETPNLSDRMRNHIVN